MTQDGDHFVPNGTRKNDALRLDPASHSAYLAGRRVALGEKAYQVLALIVDAKGRTVSTAQILAKVWGDDPSASEGKARLTVLRLRRKLKSCSIQTIGGEGYRLEHSA